MPELKVISRDDEKIQKLFFAYNQPLPQAPAIKTTECPLPEPAFKNNLISVAGHNKKKANN